MSSTRGPLARESAPPDVPTPRAVLRVVAIVVLSALALYILLRVRAQIGLLVLALFLAVCAAGPVNVLSRHMSRGLAILLVYLGIVLIPIAIIGILVPPAVRQAVALANNLPGYVADLQETINDNEQLRKLDDNFDVTQKLSEYAGEVVSALGGTAVALVDVGAALIGSLFSLVMILVLSIFMVARGQTWIDAALSTRPPEQARAARRAIDRMASAIAGYVGGALAQASVAGATSFVMLTILDIPSALPLAVIMALLDLVPLVGATLGAVIVGVVTAFADFPSDPIIWALFAIAYQQFENYVVQPRIQSRAVALDPFIVVVAAIFGAALLGVIGALLAIPTAAVIQVAVREYLAFRRAPAVRAVWAAGDYPKVARETLSELGPALVEACRIEKGQRVLDVASGSGNVALAAARAGARVVASDLTPALLLAGRAQAEAEGLELDWVQADAESLPFAGGEFDVVTSALGAMFARDQKAVAGELVRVCRPGGTIGMANWTPDGWAGALQEALEPFAAPRPQAPSPLRWGEEKQVHKLFGRRVTALECTRREIVLRQFATPLAWREYQKANFGPIIDLFRRLESDPIRTADLDRELLAFAERMNRAGPGEPAEYRMDYLLVTARRVGDSLIGGRLPRSRAR